MRERSPVDRRLAALLRAPAWGAVLFAGLWALGSGCVHASGSEQVPPPDYRAPLVKLEPAGPAQYPPSELYDHPVLATFFATWCFPCLGQLPYFAQLQQEYGGRGLRVVAVGMDLEGHKVLDPFAAQYRLPFPVLVGNDALRSGQTPFGTMRELPQTVILAKDGTVVAAWPGIAAPADVRAAVEQALAR